MPPVNFDALARPYAILERIAFGQALTRRRSCFLDDTRLIGARRALVLGDGDGRFTAALLATHVELAVTVVDSSAAMLGALESRVRRGHPYAALELHHADARAWCPERADYDLVATHFFFDCFTSTEVKDIVARVAPALTPGAFWLFSDFAIPAQPGWALAGSSLVRALYLAQRGITGLRVNRLPEHAEAFRAAGLQLDQAETALAGILRSELWKKSDAQR